MCIPPFMCIMGIVCHQNVYFTLRYDVANQLELSMEKNCTIVWLGLLDSWMIVGAWEGQPKS